MRLPGLTQLEPFGSLSETIAEWMRGQVDRDRIRRPLDQLDDARHARDVGLYLLRVFDGVETQPADGQGLIRGTAVSDGEGIGRRAECVARRVIDGELRAA